MSLYQLPVDKAEHWFYGSIIGTVTTSLVVILGLPLVWVVFSGIAAAAVIGLLKEVADKFLGTGHPELNDFLATTGGGATVSLPLIIGYLCKSM